MLGKLCEQGCQHVLTKNSKKHEENYSSKCIGFVGMEWLNILIPLIYIIIMLIREIFNIRMFLAALHERVDIPINHKINDSAVFQRMWMWSFVPTVIHNVQIMSWMLKLLMYDDIIITKILIHTYSFVQQSLVACTSSRSRCIWSWESYTSGRRSLKWWRSVRL